MNPLHGLAAILGAVALGQHAKGEVIDFWISPSNTHWAIIPTKEKRIGGRKWFTEDGQMVELISANLRDDGRGGARLVEVRWEEPSDREVPWHPEAKQAARRFKIKPDTSP